MEEHDEDQLQTLKCNEHGLRYDPVVAEGCVLCRRVGEMPASVQLTHGPSGIRWAFGAVALALGILAGNFAFFPENLGIEHVRPAVARQLRASVPAPKAPAPVRAEPSIAQLLAEASPIRGLHDAARNATVVVQTSKGSGAGVFVTTDCQVLTHADLFPEVPARSHHANDAPAERDEAPSSSARVAPEERGAAAGAGGEAPPSSDELHDVKVFTVDSRSYVPFKVERDERRGLALLFLSNQECTVPAGPDLDPVATGDPVFVVESSDDYQHDVVSTTFLGYTRDAAAFYWLELSAPVSPSAHGAPVLDEGGRVVGLAVRSASDRKPAAAPKARRSAPPGRAVPITALAAFGLFLAPAEEEPSLPAVSRR